ncbi:MAG: hypothetical protein AAB966_02085, partial [Patescibacteria group bacterium]
EIKIKDIRTLNHLTIKPFEHLYVLPYSTDIYGYNYQEQLKKNKYRKINESQFRTVSYEVWTTK